MSDLKVGQQVGLATERAWSPSRSRASSSSAGVSSIGGATLVVPTFSDAQRLVRPRGQTSVVYLQAEPGVTPAS